MVHTGAAQAGAPHPPEDPVDGRLADVADPSPADLGGEPLQVQAPIVIDRSRLAALLVQQVLVEELLDRLVDRHVPVLPVLGNRVATSLRNERGKLPRRLGLGVGLHRAMHAAHASVGVAANRNGELPHAWPNLGLRTSAAGRAALSGDRLVRCPA